MTDWIITIDSSEMENVLVYTKAGTKEEMTKLLLNLAKARIGYWDETPERTSTAYAEYNPLTGSLHVSNTFHSFREDYTATPILENMLDFAVAEKLIDDTVNERDLFDTRIMDCVIPRLSEIIRKFRADYEKFPQLATDNYYKLSIASNYIRKTRIDKNVVWKPNTEYGALRFDDKF